MAVYRHKSYFNCDVRKDMVGSKRTWRIPESEMDTQKTGTSDYSGKVNGNVNYRKPRKNETG